MKKVFIFLMAISLFTACDNNKIVPDKKKDYRTDDNDGPKKNDDDFNEGAGWSSKDKSKFKADCMTGFTNGNEALGKKICPCALEKYEKKYSSYSEVEAANDEAEGRRIGAQCKKELDGNGDDDNSNNDMNNDDNSNDDGGGWTKSDERKFVSECSGSASERLGEDRANEYCNCMLKKMKKEYSSYAAAERALNGMSQAQITRLAADCN